MLQKLRRTEISMPKWLVQSPRRKPRRNDAEEMGHQALWERLVRRAENAVLLHHQTVPHVCCNWIRNPINRLYFMSVRSSTHQLPSISATSWDGLAWILLAAGTFALQGDSISPICTKQWHLNTNWIYNSRLFHLLRLFISRFSFANQSLQVCCRSFHASRVIGVLLKSCRCCGVLEDEHENRLLLNHQT